MKKLIKRVVISLIVLLLISYSSIVRPVVSSLYSPSAFLADRKPKNNFVRNKTTVYTRSKNKSNSTSTISEIQYVTLPRVGKVLVDRESLLNLAGAVETRKRRLELVHIPKTGGTALELAGVRGGIAWSHCHHKPGYGSQSPFHVRGNMTCPSYKKNRFKKMFFMEGNKCALTHMLPCFYQEANVPSFYDGATLFTVVRNPYDRMVSEYGYQVFIKTVNPKEHSLNQWLTRFLAPLPNVMIEARLPNHLCNGMQTSKRYFQKNCHFVPQFDYVYGKARSFEERSVSHVLLFEHLAEDFAKLMQAHGLEHVTLPERPKEDKEPDKVPNRTAVLSRSDLSNATRKLIRQIYRNDFLAFGYDF